MIFNISRNASKCELRLGAIESDWYKVIALLLINEDVEWYREYRYDHRTFETVLQM